MTVLLEGVRLQKVDCEVEFQKKSVAAIASILGQPRFHDTGRGLPGFRFVEPDWRHFCLLKSARAVSGLCACCRLYTSGFGQEIMVLLRTVAESTSQIEFVIAGVANGVLQSKQQEYVDAFFADSERDASGATGKLSLRQSDVHKVAGAHADELVRQFDVDRLFENVDNVMLLSTVYRLQSNFVHSRYPETMELFGGAPVCLHLEGMRGTPKDDENLEMIETFVETVSLALKILVVVIIRQSKVDFDPEVISWVGLSAA
jgi:hypothetical protein